MLHGNWQHASNGVHNNHEKTYTTECYRWWSWNGKMNPFIAFLQVFFNPLRLNHWISNDSDSEALQRCFSVVLVTTAPPFFVCVQLKDLLWWRRFEKSFGVQKRLCLDSLKSRFPSSLPSAVELDAVLVFCLDYWAGSERFANLRYINFRHGHTRGEARVKSWFLLILFDFVWSRSSLARPTCPRRSRTVPSPMQHDRSPDLRLHAQLRVSSLHRRCNFWRRPVFVDRHGSTCHFGSLWLSSFLPSLMFKNSLQLWCFFGVGGSAFTHPSLARTDSLCAAFERERERDWYAA